MRFYIKSAFAVALFALSDNAFSAGSCVICPYGYTCAGGTNVPVKSTPPSTAPVGSVIYMSNTNAAHYDDDFYAEMGSDEKNALDSVPDSSTDSECPPGYLYADGRTLNIKDYPALFKKIGQAYGFNSSKQYASFKLPDLRGMFIRGVGGNAEELGTVQDSDNKAHSHSLLTINDSDSDAHGLSFCNSGAYAAEGVGGVCDEGTPFPVRDNKRGNSFVVSEGAAESRPVNYAMYACIKY